MSNIKLLFRAILYKISDYRTYGAKTGKDAFSKEKVKILVDKKSMVWYSN